MKGFSLWLHWQSGRIIEAEIEPCAPGFTPFTYTAGQRFINRSQDDSNEYELTFVMGKWLLIGEMSRWNHGGPEPQDALHSHHPQDWRLKPGSFYPYQP